MVFHMVMLLVMGWFVMDNELKKEILEVISPPVRDELVDEEIIEFELQEEIEAADEMSDSVMSPSIPIGSPNGGVGSVGTPAVDQEIVKNLPDATESVTIGPPGQFMPAKEIMIRDVPQGARGDERFLVENVDQALSQITKELLAMLEKSEVVVVWCFDMSGSMEDERNEIRQRIDRVYAELGISGRAKNERLTTSVTSYGSQFFVQTRRPTGNLDEIRAAIGGIPNDPTGKEYMCQAVGEAIRRHRDYAKTTKRAMALVLLTDESGEPENNLEFLEQAIAEAKAANCRIYTLGRESVFGYPHARMRWKHPETKRTHWLLVDRGPESAFVEQLQTNGFRRRHDAFSSGFGPYEQCRMANETGGIFFMLPTTEIAIVQGAKMKYQMEALRAYRPDLRSKLENFEDRDKFPMRTFLWQVVSDLNPLESPQKARELEMRVHYSLQLPQFTQQARQEQIKAIKYLQYLAAAEKVLLDNQRLREQEADPRWQANYDMMLAQLVTFQVRMYEYGIQLEWYMRHWDQETVKAPLTRGEAVLTNWAIGTRRETFAENPSLWEDYPQRDQVVEYIERARKLLAVVQKNHPGTPWAARAQWELNRGFGVKFGPDYDIVYRGSGTGITIPIPKL